MSNPSWLTVKLDDAPKWEAVRVEYISPEDERNNQGVNIYVKTVDENGVYLQGISVVQLWPDGNAQALTRPKGELQFNGEDFGVAFPMSGDSSFNPDRDESGPYSVFGGIGTDSDVVEGMGLPLKHHVQFLITFQWSNNQPPPPARRVWVVTEQSKHRIVTEKVLLP